MKYKKKFVCFLGSFLLITIIVFLSPTRIHAQKANANYISTITLGGTGIDTGTLIVKDSIGNTYMAGQFESTVNFNPDGSAVRVSKGNSDVFLVSFGPDGEFRFVKTFGSPAADGPLGIGIDLDDNVYLTGSFAGTVNFNPDGTDNRTSNGSLDIFFTSFSQDGTYRFTKAFGGTGGNEAGTSIEIDSSNNVYIGGQFESTVNFNPDGSDVRVTNGGLDVFLTSFTTDGTYRYTKTFGGASTDGGLNVNIDDSNVYITGAFSSTVNFNPDGSDVRVGNGGLDAFLTSFTTDGTYRYTKTFGGVQNQVGRALVVGPSNELYLAGYFEGTSNFHTDGGEKIYTSSGAIDTYISKFDTNGTYTWTKTLGGTGADQPVDIVADQKGNIIISGLFNSTVNFDPNGINTKTSNGDSDAYLLSLTKAGVYRFVKTFGGTGADFAQALYLDSSNKIYVSGSFNNTVNFNPDGSDVRVSNGSYDAFVAWYQITEVNSSSQNSQSNIADFSYCTGIAPATAPSLYQIDRYNDKATLYFTPAAEPTNGYAIYYGHKFGEEVYGVKFDNSDKSGAVKYTINYLLPGHDYTFRVQGLNGCVGGDLSNYLTSEKNINSRNATIKSYHAR